MAEISERKKDGKVVSFKFLACLGRDASGKRIMRAITWKPPDGISLPNARKMAEAEAYAWECALRGQEQKGEYTNAPPAPCEACCASEDCQNANWNTVVIRSFDRYFRSLSFCKNMI